MLKRGGKSSYNPYSTGQRVKKTKDRLDILPNKHNIWLKQVRVRLRVAAGQGSRLRPTPGRPRTFLDTGPVMFLLLVTYMNSGFSYCKWSVILRFSRFTTPIYGSERGSVAQCSTGSCASLRVCVYQQQRRVCARPRRHRADAMFLSRPVSAVHRPGAAP